MKEVINVLRTWLPYTAQRAIGIHEGDNTCPTLSGLLDHPGLQEIAANPDIKPVLGAARMLSKDSLLPGDHLFTALLRTELVKDMLFLLDTKSNTAMLAIDLGSNVCGHAKIVHGGLLSSICDETFGALIYCMKQQEVIGPEPAVTANLTINYRKPVPTEACLLCTSKMVKMERRKMFLEATITDVNDGSLYVEASTLFINMKPKPADPTEAETGLSASRHTAKPLGEFDLGPTDIHQWHEEPRYATLLKDIGL